MNASRLLSQPLRLVIAATALLAALSACNKDDVITEKSRKPVIGFDNASGIYPLKTGKSLTLTPTVTNAEGAVYSWTLDGKAAGDGPTFTYTATAAGTYYLVFGVRTRGGEAEEELRIDVSDPQPPVIAFITDADGVLTVAAGCDNIIAPSVANADGATFLWTLDGTRAGTERTYTFNRSETGDYALALRVENEDGAAEEHITVRVVERLEGRVAFPLPGYGAESAVIKTVSLGRTLYLRPQVEHFTGPVFTWTVDGKSVEGGSLYAYTPTAEGTSRVTVTVTDGSGSTASAQVEVRCCGAEESHMRPATGGSDRFMNKVYEYTAAPGQFINESGMDCPTAASAAAYAEELLRQNAVQGSERFVSLGAWGGYIVVGFDHSIENRGGNDFSIAGNQFEGSSEPGIVYVMQDTNENGLPDDEWYELKGSEYENEETIRDYAITYYRPRSARMGVQWRDNRGNTGELPVNNFHRQDTYYPQWITAESYTLYGTRLAPNTTQDPVTGEYANNPYEWGYADNFGTDREGGENTEAGKKKVYFKIDNAVNADGSPARLKYVDFIRVQTGIYNVAEHLGENSTEVFAFEDENIR